MFIFEQLKKDKLLAMKEKNVPIKDVLNLILTNITNEEKKGIVIDNNVIIKIIKNEIKQINDAKIYLIQNNQDITLEDQKIQYLLQFLPVELSEDETSVIINNYIIENNIDKSNIWLIMKFAKEKNLNLAIVNKIIR